MVTGMAATLQNALNGRVTAENQCRHVENPTSEKVFGSILMQ
jgi:hypothetical protein